MLCNASGLNIHIWKTNPDMKRMMAFTICSFRRISWAYQCILPEMGNTFRTSTRLHPLLITASPESADACRLIASVPQPCSLFTSLKHAFCPKRFDAALNFPTFPQYCSTFPNWTSVSALFAESITLVLRIHQTLYIN